MRFLMLITALALSGLMASPASSSFYSEFVASQCAEEDKKRSENIYSDSCSGDWLAGQEEALKQHHDKALAGDSESQYILSEAYDYGMPGGDAEKQLYWLKAAASNGHAKAQNTLAFYFLNGKKEMGIDRDIQAGIDWALKSASQGYSPAQSRLRDFYAGYFYAFDSDVETRSYVDYEKALYWAIKAAESGGAEAMRELGSNYRSGVFRHIPKDIEKSIYWYEKAAKEGSLEAQKDLGFIYKYTVGDNEKSFYWYLKAAHQGDSSAQSAVGYALYKGEGVSRNYIAARSWLNASAEQGYSAAQFTLGFMEFNGDGGPQNYKQAYIWFSLAASNPDYPVSDAAINRDLVAKRLTPETLQKAQEEAANIFEKTRRK